MGSSTCIKGTCTKNAGHSKLASTHSKCTALETLVSTPVIRFHAPTLRLYTHNVCASHSHIHTHSHKHTHTHSHTNTRTHTNTHTNTRTHTQTLTQTHAHTQKHTHTHTHVHRVIWGGVPHSASNTQDLRASLRTAGDPLMPSTKRQLLEVCDMAQ